ncbi:MAG: hypothetical protein HY240_08160 [Actinobacteria bacterium]|nr:hypothetical protein [Actinomycetota bacterium]
MLAHTRPPQHVCAGVTAPDGRAVELRGDPDHPFTRGSLCAKVSRGIVGADAARALRTISSRAQPRDQGPDDLTEGGSSTTVPLVGLHSPD